MLTFKVRSPDARWLNWMVPKFKLVSETETWQSTGKGLSEHKNFWHLAVEIPKLWLGLPALSTNFILVQSQKILRPIGTSTWGKFWERSPCIRLSFTIWLMTISIKCQAGFRAWAASCACRTLSGRMDHFSHCNTLVLIHSLTPAMRSCSPCGWSQCDVWELPYYIWYLL